MEKAVDGACGDATLPIRRKRQRAGLLPAALPPPPQSSLVGAVSGYAERLAQKLSERDGCLEERGTENGGPDERQDVHGAGAAADRAGDGDDGVGDLVGDQEPARRSEGGSKVSMLDVLAWKESGIGSGRAASEAPTEKKKGGPSGGAGTKRKQGDGLQQMFLDFGQKNFSSRTCKECGMVWCPGLPEEEAMHAKQHKRFTLGVEFRGWKGERVTRSFPDGSRIVCVRPCDPEAYWNKVCEVEEFVQRDLGSGGCQAAPGRQAHMYVSAEKRVVGFLSAQGIRRASRLVTRVDGGGEEVMELSEGEERAVCGVSEVWVIRSMRGKGIAKRLLEALLESFAPPMAIGREVVAFSQPTPAGKKLATDFFGTASFLVYRTAD